MVTHSPVPVCEASNKATLASLNVGVGFTSCKRLCIQNATSMGKRRNFRLWIGGAVIALTYSLNAWHSSVLTATLSSQDFLLEKSIASSTVVNTAESMKASSNVTANRTMATIDSAQTIQNISLRTTATHNSKRKRPTVADLIQSPLPIIVMGMPKAGTSSLAQYFQCGLGDAWRHRVSHYECKKGYVLNVSQPQLQASHPCGMRLVNNADQKRHAFEGINHYDVYTQMDAPLGTDRYFMPQISYTRAIYDAYPNATWILNHRHPQAWLKSVDKWRDLRQRFIGSTFKLPWFGKGVGVQDEEMLRFYNYSVQYIRDFVDSHPSVTLVEVRVDHPNAGDILEQGFGIDQSCWGQHNVNPGANLTANASGHAERT